MSGSTEGRKVFREISVGPFTFRSDLIAHDYMRRWALFTPWGTLRLHHTLRSDDRAHFHDHPMDFASIILWGGYIEHTPNKPPRTFRPGQLNIKRAEELHALELRSKSCWSFLFAGPVRRQWGFQTEDGWIKAGDYDEWKARRTRVLRLATPFGGV